VPPLDWDECALSHWVPGWGDDDVQDWMTGMTDEDKMGLPYTDFLEEMEIPMIRPE